MDIAKNKIVIMIGTKLYTFKSSYKIVEFFSDDMNTQNIEQITSLKLLLTIILIISHYYLFF